MGNGATGTEKHVKKIRRRLDNLRKNERVPSGLHDGVFLLLGQCWVFDAIADVRGKHVAASLIHDLCFERIHGFPPEDETIV